jgi:hypothetical protein
MVMFTTLEELFKAVDDSGFKYIRQCNSKGFGSDGLFLFYSSTVCVVWSPRY